MPTNSSVFVDDPGYAYASGMVRVLERRLMRKADYIKFIELPTEDMPQVLAEFGYNLDTDIESTLDKAMEELLSILDRYSLDSSFTDWFRRWFDFRNGSVAIKRKLWGVDGVYIDMGFHSPMELEEFLGEESRIKLHPALMKAIAVVLSRGEQVTPQDVDALLDRAYFQGLFAALPQRNPHIVKVMKVTADKLNVELALRLMLLDLPGSRFDDFSVPNGFIDERFFVSLWDVEEDARAARFLHTPYGKQLFDVVRVALTEHTVKKVESFFISLKRNILSQTVYSTYGLEILLSYFLRKKEEVLALRKIARLRIAGADTETVKRMLTYALQ